MMNLQTNIPKQLWEAIENAYVAENYSHAILEATYFISTLIRERAGVDGDGAGLVGQALGGELPKLKLNSLQSESEKNIQKGFEQILRGIYIGIRNPRSHEQTNDDKDTADAIIHFLGYIVGLLDASKEAFTIEAFVKRLVDPEFVESERYAELLVEEVPKLRVGDALIALYRERQKADLRKLRFLIRKLLSVLLPHQLDAYISVVSQEMQVITDDLDIRTTLQMLTPEIWPQIAEIARLRIENKLISGIRFCELRKNGTTDQALSTWAQDFLKSFTLRNDAANVLISRLEAPAANARNYVAKFFFKSLPEVTTTQAQSSRCIQAIVAAVRKEDDNVRSSLIAFVRHYPADWQQQLAAALVDLTDENNAAVYFDDGTPFLSSPTKDGFDDDIPF